MKIIKLTLTNFGLFRGQQAIDFSASSEARPIVLIGGRNGRGKTTLLSALQIVLYGEKAECIRDSNLNYKQQMQQFIHRGPGIDCCSLRLDFLRWSKGLAVSYAVERQWKFENGDLKESLEVLVNGERDDYLTETWREFVQDLLPLEISGLFFFDGEKIEAFANPTKSRRLLASAIGALLGLNDVNRLQKDLTVLERTKRKELVKEGDRLIIEELETRFKSAEKECDVIATKLEAKRTALGDCMQDYANADEAYRQGGAELYEAREEIRWEQLAANSRTRDLDDQLRALAEEEAPLLLVRPQLGDLSIQSKHAAEAARNQLLLELLKERDGELIKGISRHGIDRSTIELIEKFLSKDLEKRESFVMIGAEMLLSDETDERLTDLLKRKLVDTESRISDLIQEHNRADERLVELNRRILGIPAEAFILDLIDKRDRALADVQKAEKKCEESEFLHRQAEAVRDAAEKAWQKALETLTAQEIGYEETRRIIEHAALVKTTMNEFAREVTAHHSTRIASLVLDSFQRLLAKRNFVTGLRIDPVSFDVLLEGLNGERIPPEKLSAGERQLLAVAMLWGLARASGFPLPVIIDTPLGRLDGQHRMNLAKEYFPSASHQVVLLSHDEEIRGDLFRELLPSVGSSFLFEYIDQERRTEVRKGYFENVY